MSMAAIFRPLRRPGQSNAGEAGPPLPGAADKPGSRETRVGVNPVTNILPSGTPLTSMLASAVEQKWLDLIDSVLSTTGWPDA